LLLTDGPRGERSRAISVDDPTRPRLETSLSLQISLTLPLNSHWHISPLRPFRVCPLPAAADIHLFLNGYPVNAIQLDTTAAATDTIDYVATGARAAPSIRTVIIDPAAPSAPPPIASPLDLARHRLNHHCDLINSIGTAERRTPLDCNSPRCFPTSHLSPPNPKGNAMTDTTTDLDQFDEEILTYDVSDEALEAAAGTEKNSWTCHFASWAPDRSRGCCG
jgi:hypothetical protein